MSKPTIFNLSMGPSYHANDLAVDPATYPHEQSGQPVFRMEKDLISEGVFTHPTKGYSVDATGKNLDQMCAETQRLLANAVPVPIPVDHSRFAADNKGFLRSVEIKPFTGADGKSIRKLYGIIDFIGPDAALLASRNYVSPGVMPAMTDGLKRSYSNVIAEVSLTSFPVIPGQEPFKKLSVGSGAEIPINFEDTEERPILNFSIAQPEKKVEPPVKQLAAGDFCNMKYSTADMEKAHDMVPGLRDVHDDQKFSHIVRHMMGQQQQLAGSNRHFSEGVNMSTTETDPKLVERYGNLRKRDAASYKARINALKNRGVDQATILKFSAIVDEECQTIKTMSLAENETGGISTLERTLSALEGMNFVPTKESTRGQQVLKFSTTVEGAADMGDAELAQQKVDASLLLSLARGLLSPNAAKAFKEAQAKLAESKTA